MRIKRRKLFPQDKPRNNYKRMKINFKKFLFIKKIRKIKNLLKLKKNLKRLF